MKFTIGFDQSDRAKLFGYWTDILNTHQWSGGKYCALFEEKWSKYTEVPSVALANWSSAAKILVDYFGLKGKTVLVPSNTFMATAACFLKEGCQVEFVDCNKDDLCMSLDDLGRKNRQFKADAVVVVHIGGHIAFQIAEIAQWCKERGVLLIEDCAHAHGGLYHGKRAGSWGDCGIYSFYATKTISTGEGAMLVSFRNDLLEYARVYRDYGKPKYEFLGLNCRISEFNCALGCVATDSLQNIVDWKNEYAIKHLNAQFPNRLILPSGMVSGLYKYIVFQSIEKSTGKVYSDPCHFYIKKPYALPNTDWVAKNHACVPLYFRGEEMRGDA